MNPLQQIADNLSAAGLDHPAVDDAVIKLTNWAGEQSDMVLVPTEIVDRFPEINVSNYDHDDACALNAWGVELVLAAAPAHPSRGVVDEAIDERASFEADYLRRFNAPGRLGMNAEGCYGHLMTRCRFEGWQARAALQAAALPAVPEVCVWTFDDDEHAPMWTSPCGVTYSFTEGGPEDNGHKFCHSCGKPLTLAAIDARLARDSEGGSDE